MDSRTPVRVRREYAVSQEGMELIHRLSAEMGARYGDAGTGCFHPEDVQRPASPFVTGWLGERAVGCGALRPLEPEIGEVKRMYTDPQFRGRGVARAILQELEQTAVELGLVAIRLETGVRQPDAIRLYERAGYRRIPCYGVYRQNPTSICFEKQLSPSCDSEPDPTF